jgi:hypothetical protein
MKKLIIATTMLFFLSETSFAKIWRVNNMPGITADFTTAQAAHDAASAGDTIHLEPSVNNYGGVNAQKPLVWISIGSFLIDNPGNQFSTTTGKVTSFICNNGSAGTVASLFIESSCYIYASNVVLNRCHLTGGLYINNNPSNIVISQSFIYPYCTIDATNVIFSNNIVSYGITMSGYNSSAIITNNVLNFQGRNESYSGPASIYNSVFQNNISIKGGTYNFYNSLPSYNMFPDANFQTGNNNVLNANMSNVFVNSTGNVDKDFQLKTGSPAIASGYGGIDMGAFGGSTAYKLALQPAIPAITNMSTPSSTGGNTIQVTFSAKSNN